ncbi:UDP-N-acetylmuramoyl-L-alanyl-D-glutamate--2,6-diaminopimelate ligase [Corynebacterium tapiri]|uniref:UDP-N-acetylmuramoyl-L-alanyl-D-glutamate--2,6-diaminopimelate ligase n=1 Tax=Corynebacterium tapiri TaxID=1448266 RepID=A0A5C4U5S9_9CORY|nr:UDP-N-acetylmuramoyl-L-alanyl-D-glutamate--2,6-diaminopimelate ligase [Corynebacterium tapiri]TNL99403.1 UDP-N-acetylmuramoyl-L-alanyl-D-glutamate--2,6-diaminopimelate ligase [Corynebacterium tapiri]
MSTHTPVTLSRLAEIAGARTIRAGSVAESLDITSVSLDSSALQAGGLFAALPGTRVHGARFAFDCPASAILTDEEGAGILETTDERRPVLVVEDVRRVLGLIAAEIYGHPSEEFTLLGVTGTSGKTTTTYLLEEALREAGHTVAIIGTTGTRINGQAVPTSLTTPEAPKLQELFRTMADQGVSHVVMEVSSHALELGRVQGARFDVAGFTNLSQDHLDFHPTMEDYFEAKAAFFAPDSPLRARRAVVCIDDDWGKRMAQRAGEAVTVATGADADADVTGVALEQEATGAQRIAVAINSERLEFELPLPGDFNVANATLALALAAQVGVDVHAAARGISQVRVPGRMERIDEGQDFLAVVDYAHKPAAVAAVLATLHSQVDGRIGVVVGSGGDRDSSKRPLMGAEAARGADFVVVTDDNPRTEDPDLIRDAVVAGAREAGTDAEILNIGSRREAIDKVVEWAQPGDAVIVVGKGHEVGQIVGDKVLEFDDRVEVRRALLNRSESATSTNE